MKQKIEGGKKCNHNFHCYLDICERCGMLRLSKGTLATTPIQETEKIHKVKFYCSICEKDIDGKEVKIDPTTGGKFLFSHHDNHLLEIDITSLLQRKERETIKRVMDVLPKYNTLEGNDAYQNGYRQAVTEMTDNINKLK